MTVTATMVVRVKQRALPVPLWRCGRGGEEGRDQWGQYEVRRVTVTTTMLDARGDDGNGDHGGKSEAEVVASTFGGKT